MENIEDTIEDKKVYQGGCHCGKIRFKVKINQFKAIRCNCSICQKKGFLHLIISPENFSLLQGENYIKTYTFNTQTAKHKFCSICGIHPFYIPRSHPDMIDVNLNCLDENIINQIEIEEFDGQNWEENVNKIR